VYFGNLANALVKIGYVRGQNLLGAPVCPPLPKIKFKKEIDQKKPVQIFSKKKLRL
jgi:hypothetical protein